MVHMLDATPSSSQPLPGFRTYVRMLSALTRTQHLSEEFAQALLEQYARAGMLVEYVEVLCARARTKALAAAFAAPVSAQSVLANSLTWERYEADDARISANDYAVIVRVADRESLVALSFDELLCVTDCTVVAGSPLEASDVELLTADVERAVQSGRGVRFRVCGEAA